MTADPFSVPAGKFAVGQRVMVTAFDTPYACNLSGYYGHVTGHLASFVFVDLQGCISTAPDRAELERNREDEPFPFFVNELEHAD